MQLDQLFTNEQYKTKRQDWEFEYSASELSKVAKEQRDYRLGRVKVWEKEKKMLLVKIKASGISVSESVAEKMSTSNSYTVGTRGRRGAQVLIDTTMQSDLDEVMEKIKTHRELAAVYDAWYQILDANRQKLLSLNHGDWMFFFGKV